MSIDNDAFDALFDSLFTDPLPPPEEECCDDPYISEDNGYMTCHNCGRQSIQVFKADPFILATNKVQLYKRLNYFRELLYLFANIKRSNSPKYAPMIERLKKHPIAEAINAIIGGKPLEFVRYVLLEVDIVQTVRKLLLLDGSSKLYKHVYNIILDLFSFQVFDLPRRKILPMCDQFFNLEMSFRKAYPGKPNMLSYKVIIAHLLRRNGIDNHPFVLKPNNYNDVACLLSPILNETHI